MTKLIDILVLFSLMCFCACTDYAQKIKDEFEPDVFNDDVKYKEIKDSRDGQKYKVVSIDGSWWMAENLNYDAKESWCYNDDKSYCETYGRLYTWNSAIYACPEGWRLPTKAEMEKMVDSFGNRYEVASALKSKAGWKDNGAGTNSSGFSALPAGHYGGYFWESGFESEGYETNYWSSAEWEIDGENAYNLVLSSYAINGGVGFEITASNKNMAYGVRCVEDVKENQDSGNETVEISYGEMTDYRDWQSYKTVVIGSQMWMAENLNYEMENSYCYDDDKENCYKYGRLYTWVAALNGCPDEWHLPTQEEFEDLINYVGGESIAGSLLKSKDEWNGTNEYGFSALPTGQRSFDSKYTDMGGYTVFWSSSEGGISGTAYAMMLLAGAEIVYDDFEAANPVRCVQKLTNISELILH